MTSTTSAAVTPHVILALCGLALFSGCGALYRAQPLQLSPDAVMSPYVQDVYSDEPLAHWRLEAGQVGAIAGDASEAMALPESHSVELSGADFGGSELALELWVCAAQGTALTYTDSGGVDRLVLKVGQQIDLDLLGEEVAVGAMPSGRCHHLGISWRGQDGALVVVVDGKIQWMGAAARGSLPFGGRLLIGGRFRGIVDEVAVFDRFIYPGTWLRRHQVALGNSRPAVLSQRQPVRPILQTGHVGGIYSIAWSHDGRQVATGGWDQSIKVWEAQGGALLSNMRGHEGIVTGLDWSPDGTRLASSSRDNSIKVWDGVTGALVHDLRERIRGPGVVAVVWSPRGGRLASAGRDRTVKVWDAKEGKLIHELNHNAALESVVWSPNERWLASASTDGSVSVWDATNGQLVRAFEFHSDGAVEVSWSPDGSQLASASRDGTVKVVDVGSLHLAVEIKAHQAEVHALAWSPDGARIASASRDHSVKVWDPRSGTLINEHNAHTKAVRDVQFSEDGRWLASASWDGTAKVWDSRKGTVVHDFAEVRGRGVEFVSWSPDGKRLAFAGEKLNLVETVGFKRIEKSLVQTKGLVEARWHPEGSVVAALTREGKVQVWDASTAVMKHNLETRNGAGLDLAWSPDGETLASVGSGGALLAWSKDGKVIFDVKGHGARVGGLAFSPDSSKLVTFSADQVAKVWDASSGRLVTRLLGHQAEVVDAAWAPQGGRLFTADSKGVIMVWEETGRRFRTLEVPKAKRSISLLSGAWSPDGSMLAAAHLDGKVRVWSVADGRLIHTLGSGQGRTIFDIKWSPDGRRIAFEGPFYALDVWDAVAGVRTASLVGHKKTIQNVEWDAKGEQLASASWDQSVKVWDVASGALRRDLQGHDSLVRSVDWSPDGRRLCSASSDGTVKLWQAGEDSGLSLVGRPDGAWLTVLDSGYFAGSHGAANLLGMTQGARGFSVEQIAPARNRPDLILRHLGAPQREVALFEALWRRRLSRLGLSGQPLENFSSAPTVRILSAGEVDAQGVIELSTTFADLAGLAAYRVFVNGSPVSARPLPLEGVRRRLSLRVQLTRGVNLVEVTAFNRAGIESLRASKTIEVEGDGLPKPRLFFVGFGVSQYADERLRLDYAHRDVLDLQRAFKEARGSFASVETRTFVDGEVVGGAVKKAGDFLSRATEHDTVVMFIAGHGVRARDTARTYYYLDHDTRYESLEQTAIPFQDIEEIFYASRARQKLFLMDTCQSGEDIEVMSEYTRDVPGLRGRSVRVLKMERRQAPLRDRWLKMFQDRDRLILKELARLSGAIVLASSFGRESSLEAPQWENGAFTEVLIQALRTRVADRDGNGELDTDELKAYIIAAVPELTGQRQHPSVERDNPLHKFSLPIVEAP